MLFTWLKCPVHQTSGFPVAFEGGSNCPWGVGGLGEVRKYRWFFQTDLATGKEEREDVTIRECSKSCFEDRQTLALFHTEDQIKFEFVSKF